MKKENIVELFMQSSSAYPDHTAIREKKRSVTYDELRHQMIRTAGLYRQKGIGPGDRVLLFVPMSIDLYRHVLALFYVGATAVFPDQWVSRERLERCCRLAQCKAVTSSLKIRLLGLASGELRKIPVKISRGSGLTAGPETEPAYHPDPDHPALITFTTGSTGTPKAAIRTHQFLWEQFNALDRSIGFRHEETDMTTLPIVLLCNLARGSTSVIPDFKLSRPDELKPSRILRQINEYGVQRITASPFFILKLAGYILDSGNTASGIRRLFTGGAPVFPRDAKTIIEAFGTSSVTVVYGSTEAEPISMTAAEDLIRHGLTTGLYSGIPVREIEVRIIDITDKPIGTITRNQLDDLTRTPGVIGEIIVSGNHVLNRYLNNSRAFERNKITVEGEIWHRTGDSGTLTESGELLLSGRCAQLIRRGEITISPFIYEGRLKELDAVESGTVMESDDKIFLIIQSAGSGNKDQIEQKLNNTGLVYDRIIWVNAFPRDPRHNSKIDYTQLRKKLFDA